MREKPVVFCPVCGDPLQRMKEQSRFMCMGCHIVWHIANLIAMAVVGLVPQNRPMFDSVAQEGGRR
jgi:hypothetical protein